MDYQLQAVEREVFRAYDIRGIISEQFGDHAFYTLGRAIATQLYSLGRQSIFLARDGRLTSEQLAAALKAGLMASGAHVIDLGAVATPVMYYAVHNGDIDSGVMVTGSHNPADYNGIKMVLAGKTLVQTDIELLYDIVSKAEFYSACGHEEKQEILVDYQQRVVRDIKLQRPLKVVVDCGNGIAGNVIPQVIASLGCEVVPLFCEVDGNFPNHHPDPTVEENLIDLRAAVLAHKADIGLAFDGDADRLGVLTEEGEIIWPDRLMMFYARHILQRLPKSTIVFDVKCSANLAQVIEDAGGVAMMCPTGHSIVKAVMKETQAVLAGEMSGHLFFKDGWYGFDDALFSACRLLEMVSKSPLSVSGQFAAIPNSVNTPEIKIPISDAKKFSFMQQFLQQADFPDADIVRIDGMRVEFEHGWGLLRASNTTPCLIARFEAQNLESLEDIKQRFRVQLWRIDKEMLLPF